MGVKELSRQTRLLLAFPGLRIDLCGLRQEGRLSAVNLPFHSVNNPGVGRVGKGKKRPMFVLRIESANGNFTLYFVEKVSI
jgi:hypothetical protein